MFSSLIVAYLFLGGSGAGCCLVTAVLGLMADRERLAPIVASSLRGPAGRPWRRLFAASYGTAFGMLALGALCLMADAGRPDRLLLLLWAPAPSYLSFGAWAIVICGALTAALALSWLGLVPMTLRRLAVLQGLGAMASLAVILYTGLMLSDMQAVPLWNTPWLVALFALSSVSCGVALVLCAAFAADVLGLFSSTVVGLLRVDGLVIVLECLVGAFCLASVWLASGGGVGATTNTDIAGLASLDALVRGPLAVLFWGGFVVVGLALPLAQDMLLDRCFRGGASMMAMSARTRSWLVVAASLCVLFGGVALRVLAVEAAVHPAVMMML